MATEVEDWTGRLTTGGHTDVTYVDWAPKEPDDRRAELDERELFHAECKAMNKYKAFGFSWDVFLHWVCLVTLHVLVVRAAVSGRLAYWKASLLLWPIVHHSYMCLHEGVHNNVAGCPRSGRTPRLNSLVQDVVALTGSLALGLGYRSHGRDHMEHHKFTNFEARDLDAQQFCGTLGKRVQDHIGLGLSNLVMPFLPGALLAHGELKKDRGFTFGADGELSEFGEIRKAMLTDFALNVRLQFALAALTGCWSEVLCFWWLPQRLGLMTVDIVFGWLPHHPHGDVGRYKDTRVTLIGDVEPLRSILSYLVFCGHDYHLVHHLYPRVPWTRLKLLYEELEPVLKARGVRIEGGAGRPPVLLSPPSGKRPPVCGVFSPGYSERLKGLEQRLEEDVQTRGSQQWLRDD